MAKEEEDRQGRLSSALALVKTLRALREGDPETWDTLQQEYEEALDG